MMTSADEVIRRLHQHRMWSNARMVSACRGLSEEQLRREFAIGMGSVFKTLVHLFAAERVWLDVLTGFAEPRFPGAETFAGLGALEEAWAGLDGEWRGYLARLDDAKLTGKHVRRNATTSAADILVHVCDHDAYTQAQLTNMLRHLGVQPLPVRMFITMAREESAAGTRS